MRRDVCANQNLLASVAVTALLAPTLVGAQTYTGEPDYTINDTQTAYDGIGEVTTLPGGTSVLERVLYAVEQLNMTSPGAIAPVNGVYANIAESVMNREWYTTDRTEVAFENYVEDVVTPTSDPLTWANMTSPPAESTFDFATSIITDPVSGNTASVGDAELMTIHYFDLRRYPNDPVSFVTYIGSQDFTLSEFSAAAGSNLLSAGINTALSLDSNGDLVFDYTAPTPKPELFHEL